MFRQSYFLTFLLLLTLVALLIFRSLTESPSLEGLLYGSLAKNLAYGHGSLFSLYGGLKGATYSHFFPMGIYLQSLIIFTLGDSLLVEKLWGGLLCLLTSWGIIVLWRSVYDEQHGKDYQWLPLVFWVLSPLVTWSYVNNLTENQMFLFMILATSLFVLSLIHKHKWKYFLGANVFVFFAVLSMGFTGYLSLLVPVLFIIAYLQKIRESLLCFVYSIVTQGAMMAILCWIFPAWLQHIHAYYDFHFYNYFSYAHWFRLENIGAFIPLFLFLAIPLLLFLVLVNLQRVLPSQKKYNEDFSNRHSIFFFLCGFISLITNLLQKHQGAYSLLACVTFFTMAMASYILPYTIYGLNKITLTKIKMKVMAGVWTGLLILFVISAFKHPSWAWKESLSEVKKISQYINKPLAVVGASSEMCSDLYLRSYLMRNGGIVLDSNEDRNDYYLSRREGVEKPGFQAIPLGLSFFELLVRK